MSRTFCSRNKKECPTHCSQDRVSVLSWIIIAHLALMALSLEGGNWISEHRIDVYPCDMKEDMGHTVTEVKIVLPVSHNTLTSVEEHIK